MWWWQQIPKSELGVAQGPMPASLAAPMMSPRIPEGLAAPQASPGIPEVGVQPQAARVTSRDRTTGGIRISPGVVQAVGIAGSFFGVIGKAIAAIFGAIGKAQAAGPRPGTTTPSTSAGMYAGWFEPSPGRTYATTPFGGLVQAGDPWATGAAAARAESAARMMRIAALEEELAGWLATPQPVTPGGEEDLPTE